MNSACLMKKSVILYILLTVVLTLAHSGLRAAARTDDKGADSALITAVSIMDTGDYEAAIKAFEDIVARWPEYDAAHYYLGVCYGMGGRLDQAQESMRKARALDPGNVWYQDYLARVCAAKGDDEEAVSIYEEMLAAHPERTDAYYSMVNLYSRMGRADKVMGTLDEIEKVQGESEMLAIARYRTLMDQKKDDEAWKVLEAYNARYTSEEVLSMMGDHKLSQYEDSAAVAYYDEALSYSPSFGPALAGKAEAFRIGRKYPEFFSALKAYVAEPEIPQAAVSAYLEQLLPRSDARFLQTFRADLDEVIDMYVTRAPTDTTTLLNTGVYYYNTERPELTERFFKQAADACPQAANLRINYLTLLAREEKWEQVVLGAEQLYADFPDQTGALELKAIAYYNLSDYQSFIAEQERIISVAGDRRDLVLRCWSGIGDAWHLLGERDKSYKAYDKALSIDPKYVPVLNNYAYYLSEERRKLKKAYAMSKLTVEAEPDNATYLDTFGWILHLQGKDLEAKPFFKHAMLYGGKDSVVMLDHYAEVLYALGEYDMAKVYWNMARQKNTHSEVPDLEERVAARLKAIAK